MLVSDDVNRFFEEMLKTLAEQTHSQIVAVYLLSNDKKRFEHFKSIGLDECGRASFSAEEYEGELGMALSTQRIQHIADIPEDTRLVFIPPVENLSHAKSLHCRFSRILNRLPFLLWRRLVHTANRQSRC